MDIPISVIQPYGPNTSTCGYCGPPGQRSAKASSHTFGIDAVQLSCPVYQKMIDRGWRRSGEYLYKPDLARSCCPHYTIRLDAVDFKPSRSQRKIIHKFNRFVIGEGGGDNTKAQSDTSFVLLDQIHASEKAFHPSLQPKHLFEVTIEPSSFTVEKFNLFNKYQAAVHNDHDKSPSGFSRFLCETPLKGHAIPYFSIDNVPSHLPRIYGSYHQMYRLDGVLVAMGVVSIMLLRG
ncbi:Arginyl-tRNA--protein transferase 1 [Tulasnella sp. 418]|nr:Arginyl-tRNA--protein transferase 1 [Tulasnella sp. 418]